MSGPDVFPENQHEVYEYYGQVEPSQWLMRSIHTAASLIYRPRIHFAEGAQSEIEERIINDDRLIVASNHINIADQFPVSAAIKQSVELRALVGRTFTLAKADYFTKAYLKPGLSATYTLPVFRPQDVPNNRRLQADATKSLIATATARVIEGWNVLVFPEGTRNRGDPKVLGKVRGGVGRIASNASKEVGVSILPMALWYGEDKEQHMLKPDIFIGNPIVGPFPSKHDVIWPLRSALGDCVKRAVYMSH